MSLYTVSTTKQVSHIYTTQKVVGYFVAYFVFKLCLVEFISVAKILENAQLYVGEWVNAVDVFSVHRYRGIKPYITTMPATMSREATQRNKQTYSYAYYNVWPASSVFISAVALNVKLLTSHLSTSKNIFIISYAETESSIECE